MGQIKFIYLIQVHEYPEQIARLIRFLADDQSAFYIHVDLKSDIARFEFLKNLGNVQFTNERVDCIWGDFSQVEATLCLVNAALSEHQSGMVTLLSGSHYPIKSKKHIQHFFNEHSETCFLECRNPYELWPTFSRRTNVYKFNYSSSRGDYVMLKGLSTVLVSQLVKGNISFKQFFEALFVKRLVPNNMTFYGGSQWWSMGAERLEKMNAYIEKNKGALKRYFDYSLCSDEFFFQTIAKHINHQTNMRFADSTTYVSWDKNKNRTPIVFRSDLRELLSQDEHKLFARKFDPTIDTSILDEIDERIIS
jgi:hypothetical protein